MSLDLDDIGKLLGSDRDNKDKVEFLKIGVGDTLVRICPISSKEKTAKKVITHWKPKGFDDFKYPNLFFHCLKMYDLECPQCEVNFEFDPEHNKTLVPEHMVDAYKEVFRNFWGNKQLVVNALPKGIQGLDPYKPMPFGVPWKHAFKLLKALQDTEFNHDFTDYETGSAVKFSRQRKGGTIESQIGTIREPLGTPEQIEHVKANLVDIDAIYRSPDDQYVAKAKEFAEVSRRILQKEVNSFNKQVVESLEPKAPTETRDVVSEQPQVQPEVTLPPPSPPPAAMVPEPPPVQEAKKKA